MPVWFVSWPELQTAMADGVLTIGELAALPSLLVGSADDFHQTLHPHGLANVAKINLVAHGSLEDGRSFQVHFVEIDGPTKLQQRTRITIR